MTFFNHALHMGSAMYPPEYEISLTDAAKVSRVREAAHNPISSAS